MTQLRNAHSTNERLPTEELAGLRLQLRSDLTFSLQTFGGVASYVVEDAVNATFFRIGLVEYAFISLLNGQVTVSEALAKTAIAMGRDAVTEHEASIICRWLTDNRLALTRDSLHSEHLSSSEQKIRNRRWRKWMNPLSLSITLGNPSGLLNRVFPFTSWIFGPVGWTLWLGVLFIAGIRMLVEGRSLMQEVSPAISPENWLWLAMTWIGLRIVHEMAHGLCCLRYGGSVTSWGLNLILFAPLPFVDASSAWRIPSRWQRIHVAFAGVFAELLVAGVATIIRSFSEDEVTRTLCLNVMLTGGVLTLLFNLNPLSRFDGYYILCDLMEMPNLGHTAQRIVIQGMKRCFFGVRNSVTEAWKTTIFLWGFGISSAVWRLSVTVTMLFAAEKLLHGAGLPLALLAATLWLGTPILHFIQYLVRGNAVERPSRVRFAVVTILVAVAGGWLGQTIVWPEQILLPAVVDFVPAEIVRSRVAGFVDDVIAKPGQRVRTGDVLIRLKNPEIDYEVAELSLEVAQSQVRQQYFQSTGDIASRQNEDATLKSLEHQLAEKKSQQQQLVVSSPIDGEVIATDLQNLVGQFLTPGTEVCTVGNAEQKQIRLMIAQRQLERVAQHQGKPVRVHFSGDNSAFAGVLTSLDLKATSELIHPALASVTGGPLAVQVAPTSRSEDGSVSRRPTEWLLTVPYFSGHVAIPVQIRNRCGAGQLAWVAVTTNPTSLGERFWNSARDYFNRHFRDRE